MLLPGAGPAPVAAATTAGGRLSDKPLGELFLRLLPGWLYFAPALLFPLVTALAGVGAVYAPAAARWLSTQPLVMVRWVPQASHPYALRRGCSRAEAA